MDQKAVCIGDIVSARESFGDLVLLLSPSYLAKESAVCIPAMQIYLTRAEIAKLAAEFPVEED